MRFDYYKVFYYAAKHKNFTKAAQQLYTSQPAVSRTISALESELGCRLFVRSKRGLELTKEGELLYGYASSAFNQLLKGEEELNQVTSLDRGTIYISATVTALRTFLFDAINAFQGKYPNVRIKISTGSTGDSIKKLDEGSSDIAFVSTPYPVSDDHTVTKLNSFSDVLIAGNRYKYLEDKVITSEDVHHYPFISLRKGMKLREYLDEIFLAKGIEFHPDIEADGADIIVDTVKANLGLGFVPYSLAEAPLNNHEVIALKHDLPLKERSIVMITSNTHSRSNASRQFVKMIKEKIFK